MFIKISWKNSKGEVKETLVESEKVQGFINGFVEREVEPHVAMPDEVVLSNQIDILTLQQR